MMDIDFRLRSDDQMTQLAIKNGIHSWQTLLKHVRGLPYGRNANRWDFGLVLKEGQGSCSSKHALLKSIATYHDMKDIKLILGIYKMNRKNTPGIGQALESFSIDYVPEAHCYLSFGKDRYDYTSPQSSFATIENDILSEIEIIPEQVSEHKITLHQDYIKNWIMVESILIDFDQIWKVRELCINNLSLKL